MASGRPQRSGIKAPAKYGASSPSPVKELATSTFAPAPLDPTGPMNGGQDFLLMLASIAVDQVSIASAPPPFVPPPPEMDRVKIQVESTEVEENDPFDDQPVTKKKKPNPPSSSATKPRSMSVKERLSANFNPTASSPLASSSSAAIPLPSAMESPSRAIPEPPTVVTTTVTGKRKGSDGMMNKPTLVSKAAKKIQSKTGIATNPSSKSTPKSTISKLMTPGGGSTEERKKPVVASPMNTTPAVAPRSAFENAMSSLNDPARIGGITKIVKKEIVAPKPSITVEEIQRLRTVERIKNEQDFDITYPLLDPGKIMGEFEGKLRTYVHTLQAEAPADRPLPRLNTFGSVFSLFPSPRPHDLADVEAVNPHLNGHGSLSMNGDGS